MFKTKGLTQEQLEPSLQRIGQWKKIFKNPQSISDEDYKNLIDNWEIDIGMVQNILLRGSVTQSLSVHLVTAADFINQANRFFVAGFKEITWVSMNDLGSKATQDQINQNIGQLKQAVKKLTPEKLRNAFEPTTLTAATILGSGDPGGIWNDTASLKIKTQHPKGNRLIEELGPYNFMINSQSFNFDSDTEHNKSDESQSLEEIQAVKNQRLQQAFKLQGFTEEEFEQFKNADTQNIFSNPWLLLFPNGVSSGEHKLNIIKRDNQVFVEATQKLYMQGTQKNYLGEMTATYKLNSDSSLQLLKITTRNKPEHFNTTLYDRFMNIKAKKAKKDIESFCALMTVFSYEHIWSGSFPLHNHELLESAMAVRDEPSGLHKAIWENEQSVEILNNNPKLLTSLMNSYDFFEGKSEINLSTSDLEASAKETYMTARTEHKGIKETQDRRSSGLFGSNRVNKKVLGEQEKAKEIRNASEALSKNYEHNKSFSDFFKWLKERIMALFSPKTAPEESTQHTLMGG